MPPPDLAGFAAELVTFLRPWEFLWGSVVVELFEKELWRTLDESWVEALKDVQLEELLQIPMGQCSSAWPESLQSFVAQGQRLSLPRCLPNEAFTNLHSLLTRAGYASLEEHGDLLGEEQATGLQPGDYGFVPHCPPNSRTDAGPGVAVKAVPMFLLQGMNPKKQHEVLELAPLIAHLARAVSATHIIDVGAGQGSLAQVLALSYKLPVIGVETSEHNSKMASRRASKAKRVVHKREGLDAAIGSDKVGQSHNKSSGMPLDSGSTPMRTGQESGAAGNSNASHPWRHPGSDEAGGKWDEIFEPKMVTATISMHNVAPVLAALVESTFPVAPANVPLDRDSHVARCTQGAQVQDREFPKGCSPAETCQDQSCSLGTSDAQARPRPRVLLVGLHACGDLSPAILRAFAEWEDVVAVVSLGCCYNMLSEQASTPLQARDVPSWGDQQENSPAFACSSSGVPRSHDGVSGFPMSRVVRSLGLVLGHSGRDLALQSADRWRTTAASLARENFQAHTFRAALPLVVRRQFPGLPTARLRVGHLGKAARRKKLASLRTSPLQAQEEEVQAGLGRCNGNNGHAAPEQISEEAWRAIGRGAAEHDTAEQDKPNGGDRLAFQEYFKFAMQRLGLPDADPLLVEEAWAHVAPLAHLVPSFYMLRAVLAPVLESLIIIDRLLYMEEQGCDVQRSTLQPFQTGQIKEDSRRHDGGELAAAAFPVFKPDISPRNIAVVALRNTKSTAK